MPYCKEHGIQTYRRKSGGGCVYSDKGNLMLSYITKGDSVGFYFDRYIRRVAFMLQKKGVNAQVAGRNDILIDGKKVSGNAFYKIPGKCIIHGTLLFDTDFDSLQQAITPSDNKLKSKGVASVRQHVTNLSEHLDMDIEDFKKYLIDDMCRGEERTLTAEEVARIEQIEQTAQARNRTAYQCGDVFIFCDRNACGVRRGGIFTHRPEVQPRPGAF